MALPNTGITTTMVGQELGISTRNVGNLCRSEAINKWSRWKPVRHSTVAGLTEANIKNAKGGLNLVKVNGYTGVMNYYRNNPNFKFEYLKPRGSAFNEPYRLGDFRTYDKEAGIFYDVVVPNTIFTGLVNIRFYTYYPYFPSSDLHRWLNWDFLGLNDLHFGVIIVRKGLSTNPIVHFSDTTLAAGGGDILIQQWFDPIPATGTEFDVFAFIGLPVGEEDPDSFEFYILENGQHPMVYVRQLEMSETSAEFMGDRVEYDINIVNYTSSNITITGVELMFRYDGNGIDDEIEPLEPTETIVSLGNITIPANDTYNISSWLTGALPELPARGGYIYFRVNSHWYLNTIIPIRYS